MCPCVCVCVCVCVCASLSLSTLLTPDDGRHSGSAGGEVGDEDDGCIARNMSETADPLTGGWRVRKNAGWTVGEDAEGEERVGGGRRDSLPMSIAVAGVRVAHTAF